MAFQYYMIVKGSKQGNFTGESQKKQGYIPILSFSFGVTAAMTSAAGQASGKRGHQSIVVTKEWGAASIQFFRAVTDGEPLTSVLIIGEETTPDGSSAVRKTFNLKNAFISSFRTGPATSTGRQQDQATFDYEQIEIDGTPVARIPPSHITRLHHP
jgi:type VI secretion system secreted protein Hcp